MKYNPERYYRRSIRLRNYDYANAGAYFVTICARNRECIFSEFIDNVGAGLAPAQLARYDVKLASVCNVQHATAQNMKQLLQLTEIGKIIDKNWRNIPNQYEHADIDEFIIMPNHVHGIIMISSDDERASARVGQIIGAFKSRCVTDYLKYIYENRINDIGKIWQRNYYERIIRNEKELLEIRKYILENPLKWSEDTDNPVNINLME